MPNLSLRLELEGGRTEFRPRDSVSGRAIVDGRDTWKVQYAEIAIGWRTEGVGDEDNGLLAKREMAEKGDEIRHRLEERFHFDLPEMPWTYHGRLIKIHWFVGIYAKERGEDEESVEVEITVHPSAGAEAEQSVPADYTDPLAPPPLPEMPPL